MNQNKNLPLTEWEKSVLREAMCYISKNNHSPTRKELAIILCKDGRAIPRIHSALINLEKKGWVKIKTGSWRNITILKNENE